MKHGGKDKKDFPLWAYIDLELLKENAYDLVNWENMLKKIEDMELRHLEKCTSQLAVILEYLYKWDDFGKLTYGGEDTGGIS